MGTPLLALLALSCCHAAYAQSQHAPANKLWPEALGAAGINGSAGTLTVTFHNKCEHKLWILADSKTTIND
eukprot:COSAG02_NODE_21811_length_774_cov_1.262222_1_plen_71_part_00